MIYATQLFKPGTIDMTPGLVVFLYNNQLDVEHIFHAGEILTGLEARAQVSANLIGELVCRHITGDWGLVDEEDKRSNYEAVQFGGTIMSVYELFGERIWIVTDSQRSRTTVMLPREH